MSFPVTRERAGFFYGFLPEKTVVMSRRAAAVRAEVMFVGAEPSELLTKMIKAMGLALTDIVIQKEEIRKEHLSQIVSRTKTVVILGEDATQALLSMSVSAARGRWHEVESEGRILQVRASFHPRELIENSGLKREAWEDLKAVLALLGKEIPLK